MSCLHRISVTAVVVLAATQILAVGGVHAEPAIQVTNGTSSGFWVMAFDQDDMARTVTYAAISHHVAPGETTQLACGGALGCDLLLDRAPSASAPRFKNVTADCIRVTTYISSRGNAAYSAC